MSSLKRRTAVKIALAGIAGGTLGLTEAAQAQGQKGVRSWVLIEGGSEERLRSVSLLNAKQLVKGSVGKEMILHVEAS